MSLKDQVEKFREETIQKAGKSIEGLASAAINLESPVSEKLKELNVQLKSNTFNLIIVGRFNNGKSTLMNTLLGKTTHSIQVLEQMRMDDPTLGPMPTDDLPCTATLTGISYSQMPFVRVWHFDGSKEDWTLARYLNESKLSEDDDINELKFKDIAQFEIGLPSSLCQAGVTLFDSPGTDEDPKRTEVARRCAETCDAAIVVYRSDSFGGGSELKFFNENIVGRKTRAFTVVNLMHNRKIDERLRGLIWNKLVYGQLGGEKYSGQDLTTKDIYLIDALSAYRGVMTNDQQLIDNSGLAFFEKRLGEFLTNDKHLTHIKSFIDKSDVHGGELIRNIELRKEGLKRDTGVLLQAYEKIKPKLVEVHSKRENLPIIFNRYAKQSERELVMSAKNLVHQIHRDLPEAIADKPLPTLSENSLQIANPMKQKQLVKESLALCKGYIEEKFKEWEGKEAQRILEPILVEMQDHINEEIARVERSYQQIHFELTGVSPDAQEFDSTPKWVDRIVSGGVGVILLNPGAFISGSGGGWKGLTGALAAQILTGIALTFLGITSLPVIIVVATITGLFGGGIGSSLGLEKRLKTKASDDTRKILLEQINSIEQIITENVDREFGKIKDHFMTGLSDVMNQEENNIRKMMEENQLQQLEKQKVFLLLENSKKQINQHRQELQALLISAQQKL